MMRPFIHKLLHLLEIFERSLLVFLLLILVMLSFLQVLLREFFSTGLLWADVFLRHLVVWVGFLGAAIAVRENKHFAIDLAKKFIPSRIKGFAKIVTDLFASGCLTFLCVSAIKFFKDEVQSRSILFTVGNFDLPAFWIDIIIPLGFILLFVHFLLKTAEDVLRSVKTSE